MLNAKLAACLVKTDKVKGLTCTRRSKNSSQTAVLKPACKPWQRMGAYVD